jgi:hypothetical protein
VSINNPPRHLNFYRQLFRVGIVSLPYVSYLGMVAIGISLIYLLKTLRRSLLDQATRNGLLLISGLMVLSGLFAFERGEALLQLTNYLPFFLFFALLPYLLRGTAWLEQTAFNLVIASIPLNLLALVEYLLRADFVPRSIRRIGWVRWIRSRPHAGRAMLMFDHPNALAGYLVLIFGLGLGVILCHSVRQRSRQTDSQISALGGNPEPVISDVSSLNVSSNVSSDALPAGSHRSFVLPLWLHSPLWLYSGTFLNLVGIFCTGSRNGLLVAISQLILVSGLNRTSRTLWIAGWVSMGSVLLGVLALGLGGRSHLWGTATDESRLLIWRIALDLIRERPLLGWGLGNYKFLYPSRIAGLNISETYVGHPHNLWLMLACEGGLLVAIALTLWVGWICFRAVRCLMTRSIGPIEQALLLGFLAAFWGSMAFSLFDVPLFDARLNVMSWVLLAGIYTLTKFSQQFSRQTP